LFPGENENLKAEMKNVMHYPLGEYAELHLGGGMDGEFGGFQGYIAGLALRLGPGAVYEDIGLMRKEVELYYNYKMGTLRYNPKQTPKT
jgi:hypothetical protein